MDSRLDLMNLLNRTVLQHIVLFLMIIQEKNSLPLPKIEGDDRAQARALSIIYSHPVVSFLYF
jgi:hypothetical protein